MAKSRKAMNKSLKSTGDAWRAHVANVAKMENVKYGKAMSLASKGKYGAEWKKIKAGMGSGKKSAAVGGGMAALNPASVQAGGADVNPYNEPNDQGAVPGKEGFAANAAKAGGRRRTKKAKGRKGKRGGALALVM
jgi:hypothetical protein